MIEALVAVTILAVAIALTIQPVMAALSRVSDARVVSVAENLAQAEIESIRALKYEDVGLPGRTPSGVLTEVRTVNVEGRAYLIEMDVEYAGSLTGLDVVPQGGDGVEGTWDAGVDYKTVVVTVTPEGRETDPVIMETIVAPNEIGAHEGIANARVNVVAHEPFATSGYDLPRLAVHAPPSVPIRSSVISDSQVFPAIPSGDYSVVLDLANGWIIHPGDVVSGATELEVRPGSLAETNIRVYRPASMEVTVRDSDTGDSITGARLTLTLLETGMSTVYDIDDDVVAGLIPDVYDIAVDASGYETWTAASVTVPSGYPDPVHRLDVYMVPRTGVTTTTTTTTVAGSTTTTTTGGTTTTTTPAFGYVSVEFTVEDEEGEVIAGATVTVDHPTRGTLTAVTDDRGRAYLDLEEDEGFTATASTVWGHQSESGSFRVDPGEEVELKLDTPRNDGLMTLKDGDRAEFLYKPKNSSTWTVLPTNYRGQASFADDPGKYIVAKRCLANGDVVGERETTLKANKSRSTSVRGWCP